MKKSKKPDPLAERPNLDWSKAVRGKYYERAIAAKKDVATRSTKRPVRQRSSAA
jgi:hypothetical protein